MTSGGSASGINLGEFNGTAVNEYCESVLSQLMKCQQSVGELKKWEYYVDYPGVRQTMKSVNSLVENLIGKIFLHNDIKLKLHGRSMMDKFEILREGNDALLERVSLNLDEASGIRRIPDTDIVDTTIRTIQGPVNPITGQGMILHASRNVQKPQLLFQEKINNSTKEPFIPLIKEKPHSLKPLSVLLCINESENEYYSHPYEYELQHWSPPESVSNKINPTLPLPMSTTPLFLVEDVAALQTVIEELKSCKEIAVDLEHHSFRSYQGLTCLMQISSRSKDYIIDILALRGELSIFNEIFTNPKITKVFHGANRDIEWLQRDCGVYVVNMFDTHQASVVLDYPQRSLSALLVKFCSIHNDKSYQRADWRERPLPQAFLDYARSDTHYLLYIHDCLRNELLDKGNELNNLLRAVYDRSTAICLTRYEKPMTTSDSHLNLYRNSRKTLNSRQLYALRELYQWRDKIAREQDESVEFVLAKHMMLQISEVLPKEMQGILACCNPIPSLVKTELLTLHQIIQKARMQPLSEIEMNLSQIDSQESSSVVYDISSDVLRKHDLSQVEENATGLQTLLNSQETLVGDLFDQSPVKTKLKKRSQLFGLLKNNASSSVSLELKMTEEFMSPYQRYQCYLQMEPLLDDRREKDLPVDTTDRIQNVLDHISTSLTPQKQEVESDLNVSQTSEVSDQDRLSRLKECTMQATASDSTPAFPDALQISEEEDKPPRRKRMSLKEKRAFKASKNRKPVKPLGLETGKKRKNEDGSFKRRKRSKGGSDVPDADLIQHEAVSEVHEEPVDIKPFNYGAADYTIFKKAKSKVQRKGPNIQDGFRSIRPKGAANKKSGMKSFTWSYKHSRKH